jgi:hypothetical protein
VNWMPLAPCGDALRNALTWPEIKVDPLAPARIARSLLNLREAA